MSIEFTYTQQEVDTLCNECYAKGRADAIDKFISKCVRNGIIGIGTMHDMVLIAEQMKEQNGH